MLAFRMIAHTSSSGKGRPADQADTSLVALNLYATTGRVFTAASVRFLSFSFGRLLTNQAVQKLIATRGLQGKGATSFPFPPAGGTHPALMGGRGVVEGPEARGGRIPQYACQPHYFPVLPSVQAATTAHSGMAPYQSQLSTTTAVPMNDYYSNLYPRDLLGGGDNAVMYRPPVDRSGPENSRGGGKAGYYAVSPSGGGLQTTGDPSFLAEPEQTGGRARPSSAPVRSRYPSATPHDGSREAGVRFPGSPPSDRGPRRDAPASEQLESSLSLARDELERVLGKNSPVVTAPTELGSFG
eukprot:GHVU01019207.1.p1 GENE.GHVU01019207.1~~GHVU01019207.1.p1  ORF type:complete len:298 (-),score=12.95 GHVU01019207.1:249-1142(-)